MIYHAYVDEADEAYYYVTYNLFYFFFYIFNYGYLIAKTKSIC